ncbi:MAG: hypothetical protein D6675_11665 [Gemmatimonadetes bacterium]|nr:MAG: hypothetical protein D6675_11665 [Gemmatimonadota bacterium]
MTEINHEYEKRQERIIYIFDGISYFPFSKGILAKSLTNNGLEIEAAYEVARIVGTQLRKKEQPYLQLADLKQMVYHVLREEGLHDVAEYYHLHTSIPKRRVMVRTGNSSVPYSRWILAQGLKNIGLEPTDAITTARDIEQSLLNQGFTDITQKQLQEFVSTYLAHSFGYTYSKQYMDYQEVKTNTSPIILLIGGATGSGKSTLARKLASRFEIGRFVSTDIIREVMRTIFTDKIAPYLHHSSYVAYREVPTPGDTVPEKIITAFREQARQVMVGINALVERALRENLDIIVEGVHVVPGMLDRKYIHHPNVFSFAVITQDETAHRSHFIHRENEARQRRAETYLKNLGSIRQIQQYLINQAKKYDVPLVDNENLDEAIRQATHLVMDHLAQITQEKST